MANIDKFMLLNEALYQVALLGTNKKELVIDNLPAPLQPALQQLKQNAEDPEAFLWQAMVLCTAFYNGVELPTNLINTLTVEQTQELMQSINKLNQVKLEQEQEIKKLDVISLDSDTKTDSDAVSNKTNNNSQEQDNNFDQFFKFALTTGPMPLPKLRPNSKPYLSQAICHFLEENSHNHYFINDCLVKLQPLGKCLDSNSAMALLKAFKESNFGYYSESIGVEVNPYGYKGRGTSCKEVHSKPEHLHNLLTLLGEHGIMLLKFLNLNTSYLDEFDLNALKVEQKSSSNAQESSQNKQQSLLDSLVLADFMREDISLIELRSLFKEIGSEHIEKYKALKLKQLKDIWLLENGSKRLEALEQIRFLDPKYAIDLLANNFLKSGTIDQRRAFLRALEINLSDLDIKFLENLLDTNKSKDIAVVALDLLMKLPHSPTFKYLFELFDQGLQYNLKKNKWDYSDLDFLSKLPKKTLDRYALGDTHRDPNVRNRNIFISLLRYSPLSFFAYKAQCFKQDLGTYNKDEDSFICYQFLVNMAVAKIDGDLLAQRFVNNLPDKYLNPAVLIYEANDKDLIKRLLGSLTGNRNCSFEGLLVDFTPEEIMALKPDIISFMRKETNNLSYFFLPKDKRVMSPDYTKFVLDYIFKCNLKALQAKHFESENNFKINKPVANVFSSYLDHAVAVPYLKDIKNKVYPVIDALEREQRQNDESSKKNWSDHYLIERALSSLNNILFNADLFLEFIEKYQRFESLLAKE